MPSNWWLDSQPGPGLPGGATTGGGGSVGRNTGTAGAVQYRSPLDAARASQGKIPSAEYPDGYLGTIIDRHQDKLLDSIQEKLTERSYQRGVHKGAKIPGTDYFWPDGFTPDRRLKAQARAAIAPNGASGLYEVKRFAPTGNPVERLAHLGKMGGLSTPEQMGLAKQYGVSVAKNPVVVVDPTRQARMQKMLPQYARTM